MSKFTRLAGLCISLVFPWLAAAAEFPVDRPVAEDTPASTVAGNPFTIPAGWSASVEGPATIITPPEGGSHIVYVDVEAEDAESALAKAWAAYKEPDCRRKLLEVLFDGKPEADAQLAANAEVFKSAMAREFELLSVPASTDRTAALAGHYRNEVLGDVRVQRGDGVTTFDFGEWRSEVGSRENPDGTTSFMTIVPGLTGLEFVVGEGEEKTLIMRDAQHEYVFDAI